jgi:four helix bundle protein
VVVSYRDLSVWQRAMSLVELTYSLTAKLPHGEVYGLKPQLQRAAVSVPSNIAEGHARDSTKEYLRFLSVALGSLAELETQFLLCQRLDLLPGNDIDEVLRVADEIGKMIRGLRKGLTDRLTRDG